MLKEIYIIDSITDTPACCYIGKGIMLISARHFNAYPVEYRFFILLHEYAHLTLASENEQAADKYAFDEYAKRGYSLKRLINCISDLLQIETIPEHRSRAVKLFELCLKFQEKNGN